eukprot:773059-Pelagomonas_calceolata.AAC.1
MTDCNPQGIDVFYRLDWFGYRQRPTNYSSRHSGVEWYSRSARFSGCRPTPCSIASHHMALQCGHSEKETPDATLEAIGLLSVKSNNSVPSPWLPSLKFLCSLSELNPLCHQYSLPAFFAAFT